MELPTPTNSARPMPIAEALASTKHIMRPTHPLPLPPSLVSAASVDRLEDRSDTATSGSSGTYFSSLRSSYDKLRITKPESARSPITPSLPSLKSSGLLESWTHHSQSSSQQRPDTVGMSEPPTSPIPPWMVLRTATAPKDSTVGPSESNASSSTSSRSTKSTMPVGLDWLAHER